MHATGAILDFLDVLKPVISVLLTLVFVWIRLEIQQPQQPGIVVSRNVWYFVHWSSESIRFCFCKIWPSLSLRRGQRQRPLPMCKDYVRMVVFSSMVVAIVPVVLTDTIVNDEMVASCLTQSSLTIFSVSFVEPNLCERVRCLNAGVPAIRSVTGPNECVCLCKLGTSGEYCELNGRMIMEILFISNECRSFSFSLGTSGTCGANSCLNGGSCRENRIGTTVYAYCECAAGFKGPRCETRTCSWCIIFSFMHTVVLFLFRIFSMPIVWLIYRRGNVRPRQILRMYRFGNL